MFIHVQRESGLAHRTLTLRPWQVQALRLLTSRWFVAVVTIAALSWGYFAVQTARVPFLTRRISHLEREAAKIDTLQATLDQVQKRYEQVQQMLSASTRSLATAKTAASPGAPRTAPVAAKGVTNASASVRAKPAAAAPTKAPDSIKH